MRPWRTLARRVLLSRPPWMEVAEERIALPDGREIEGFLSIRTRDFAAIVAVTEPHEVVLIRSYKHGSRRVSLAVPAGYIEEGEDPLTSAKRELREETGYEASELDLARSVRRGRQLRRRDRARLPRVPREKGD